MTNEQRGGLMLPLLRAQFQMLNRPVAGESELDATRRQIEAEGVKSTIMEQFGAHRGQAALLGGGRFPLWDRRLPAVMRQLDEDASIARRYTRGGVPPLSGIERREGGRAVLVFSPHIEIEVDEKGLSQAALDAMRRELDRLTHNAWPGSSGN